MKEGVSRRLLSEVTGNPVVFVDFAPLGYLGRTPLFCDGAASVKDTTGWRIRRAWKVAFEDHAFANVFGSRIGNRHGRQQRLV